MGDDGHYFDYGEKRDHIVTSGVAGGGGGAGGPWQLGLRPKPQLGTLPPDPSWGSALDPVGGPDPNYERGLGRSPNSLRT